ncbi:MAG: DNA glycosylase [Clostridia bacterium]|nr:DNA glycosylase [Clostridia bacterium]
MIVSAPAGFDLAATLACGQCFRWEETPAGWHGVAYGRPLTVRQDGDRLEFFCSEEEFERLWKPYFDLELDYYAILQEIAGRFPVLQAALPVAGGIRILRQEPWEALCSFIISQNNNIKRISSLVKKLCAAYGTVLEEGDYAFPTPAQLAAATEDELRALGFGYRAPYLLDAAKKVADGEIDLDALQTLPEEETLAALQSICGVGPKVAQCALLYGLHRLDAFPMDVWMKRAMARYFPKNEPKDFGPYAGIAQQVIFHTIRTADIGTD